MLNNALTWTPALAELLLITSICVAILMLAAWLVSLPLKKLQDWDTVKRLFQPVVQHLAKTIPQKFVAKSGPKNRVGKIFVDYLRNGFGATTVSAWSVRARSGLVNSLPISRHELQGLS